MTLRVSDLQLESDLDSIRNSCDVFDQQAGGVVALFTGKYSEVMSKKGGGKRTTPLKFWTPHRKCSEHNLKHCTAKAVDCHHFHFCHDFSLSICQGFSSVSQKSTNQFITIIVVFRIYIIRRGILSLWS